MEIKFFNILISLLACPKYIKLHNSTLTNLTFKLLTSEKKKEKKKELGPQLFPQQLILNLFMHISIFL